MSTAKTHARNLGMTWLGHGANLAVMFFLSPFILHSLGQVEFGIWSLLTVLTGYMGLLDLGIRSSTGRFIMLYLGKEDRRAVDETIRTALGFYSGLGLLVVTVGAGLGWLFPAVFRSVPSEYHLLTQLLLPLLALNVWVSAMQGVFSSLLAAHERFELIRYVDLGVLAVRTVATVIALSGGYRIGALAAIAVGSQTLAAVGNYVLARRVYPNIKLWPLLLDRVRLRELFGYGLAACVSAASVKIIGQADLIVAGTVIGVSAVAIYSVGAMLVYYCSAFLTHIQTILFPAIQRAVARDERGTTRWLYLRACRLHIVCGLLVYVGIIIFAEPFIRLWMLGPAFGEESVQQAALVMQLLAAAKLPILFRGASRAVLNALGRVRLTASLVAAEAVLNIVLSLVFVMVFNWGLAGIAGGTLVARMLVGTFILPWFACAATGVAWEKYLIRNGGAILLVGGIFGTICVGIHSLVPGGTWMLFFIQVSVATGAYGFLAFWLLIAPSDRRRIWTRIVNRPDVSSAC